MTMPTDIDLAITQIAKLPIDHAVCGRSNIEFWTLERLADSQWKLRLEMPAEPWLCFDGFSGEEVYDSPAAVYGALSASGHLDDFLAAIPPATCFHIRALARTDEKLILARPRLRELPASCCG